MTIGHTTFKATIEVAAGTAFELLIALAGASAQARDQLDPGLADALDAVGDTAGESWLNLVGVALDEGAPYDAGRLINAAERMDPVTLRLHLLGRYSWSWCTLVGTDTITAAAQGDPLAASKLLAHDRYYAGHAKASLATLVRLEPEQTRAVLARALEVAARVLPMDGYGLEASAVAATDELSRWPLADAIERITGGYRYAPEPEAERVLLMPHTRPDPSLVLAQHRGTRLIVYRARVEQGAEERVAALGHALSDPKRVEILSLVARGVDRVSELVERTGLARSTVHHHLGELRGARLVDLEGNARAYRYRLRANALDDTAELLSEVLPPS